MGRSFCYRGGLSFGGWQGTRDVVWRHERIVAGRPSRRRVESDLRRDEKVNAKTRWEGKRKVEEDRTIRNTTWKEQVDACVTKGRIQPHPKP